MSVASPRRAGSSASASCRMRARVDLAVQRIEPVGELDDLEPATVLAERADRRAVRRAEIEHDPAPARLQALDQRVKQRRAQALGRAASLQQPAGGPLLNCRASTATALYLARGSRFHDGRRFGLGGAVARRASPPACCGGGALFGCAVTIADVLPRLRIHLDRALELRAVLEAHARRRDVAANLRALADVDALGAVTGRPRDNRRRRSSARRRRRGPCPAGRSSGCCS